MTDIRPRLMLLWRAALWAGPVIPGCMFHAASWTPGRPMERRWSTTRATTCVSWQNRLGNEAVGELSGWHEPWKYYDNISKIENISEECMPCSDTQLAANSTLFKYLELTGDVDGVAGASVSATHA